MHCTKCSNQTESKSKFCAGCGTPIKEVVNLNAKTNTDPRNYIPDIIRAKAKRRLLLDCIVLALGCLILFSEFNFITSVISNPKVIDNSVLEKELTSDDVKDKYIILPLQPDQVYGTGYTDVRQIINDATNKVEGETTNAEYYLTSIGKHLLVIRGPVNQMPSGNFTGFIRPIDEDLYKKLVHDFNADPKLKNLTSSIVNYEISNEWILQLEDFWSSMLGLALFCYGAIIVVKRLFDLKDKKHYVYSILDSSGYTDIGDLSVDFVKSCEAGVINFGGYKQSNRYFFRNEFFSFKVYHISQIYWAYKKITEKRVHGIPAGKKYSLILHFKPKKWLELDGSENAVDQNLLLLTSSCPQAKFGYNK